MIHNGLGSGGLAVTKFISGSTAGSANISNGCVNATELNDASAGTGSFTNVGGGYLPGDGNAAGLADNGDGLLIGADTPLGTQARIGITGGASRNTLSVNDRSSWGRQTSTWLGGFAGYAAGAFGLRGGVAYA